MFHFAGFGFAVLANVPPVHGLYTSFWSVLIYLLFGQSHHNSFGAMAIMSIMVAEATSTKEEQTITDNGNWPSGQLLEGLHTSGTNQTHTTYQFGNTTIDAGTVTGEVASETLEKTMLVTMVTGVILIIMSIFKLGKIVVFIPMSCISGFTTAAAFHILTSQMKFILGVTIHGHTGVFKFVKVWREIILGLPDTNTCDLVISICCFIFLVVIKEIANPKLKDKLPVPIPAEIIVVTIVTLLSYLASLQNQYGIKIVNEVPAGFYSPSMPNFDGFAGYIVDAFLIAIISFVISYSMVSTYSQKHKYEVDAGQEMVANGMYHLIGSIFGGFPAAAGPPRCTVLDTTGAKTQVVHVFTLIVLLLTILFIGPLFEPLPNSCLSTIIVCALIPLFKQFQHPVQFWRVNKYDSAIWMVTWSSALFLDIDIGLAIGIGFSVSTIAITSCLATGDTLVTTGYIDLQNQSGRYELSEEIPAIKVFRFNSSLNFVSQAQFKDQLFQKTIDPGKRSRIIAKTTEAVENKQIAMNEADETAKHTKPLLTDLHDIVIDFSSITYIDVMGLNLVKQLKADYSHVGINLVLANCSEVIINKLKAAGIYSVKGFDGENKDPDKFLIFPTIYDAISYLMSNRLPSQGATDQNTPVSEDNINHNIPVSHLAEDEC